MIPSAAELRYFLEVADTENISRAAERVGVSQPSLSLAIQRLESSLGTPLLIRGKSGARLTQAGQRFAVHARSLLNEWENLKQDTLRGEAEISGRYTLGCHPSVALYALPHLIPELLKNYPRLELKLVHELSRKITEDVISFRADFGIVVNPVKHPDLVIRLLAQDEVTFWRTAAPSPLLDTGSKTAVLLCDPDLSQTQNLLRQLSHKKMSVGRILTSSSLEVIAALTGAGAGIGILPGRVAERIPGLKLKKIPDSPKFLDSICLIYRADAQKSHASRELAQQMEKTLIKHI